MKLPSPYMPGIFLLLALHPAISADLPLLPDDLAIVRKIAEREKLDAPPVAEPPGQNAPRASAGRLKFSAKADGMASRRVLHAHHDAQGRVVGLLGNGPTLCNEAFGWIAALPELRVIRIDHNTPVPKSPVPKEQYDGSGIIALKNSKLEELGIGHAFGNAGMAALAQIPSLKKLHIFHSYVTDEGTSHLKGHATLEDVQFDTGAGTGRPMGPATYAVLATLPRLKRVAMHETFVKWEDGFSHLQPLSDQIEAISLTFTLVLPADLARLKTEFPKAKFTTGSRETLSAYFTKHPQIINKWATPEAAEYLRSLSETARPSPKP
jgi:hypothetical protein